MPDISTNLGLNLPKGSDTFDYDVFLRQNFQKIDDKAASTDASLADRATDLQSREINVKYPFGTGLTAAKLDGVTDDKTAIQAMLNAGYSIYIPDGTALISSSLNIAKHGQKIRGAGRSRAKIQTSGAFDAIVNPSEYYFVSLEDISILGQGTTAGIGLNLKTSPQVSIKRVVIDKFQKGLLLNTWLSDIESVQASNCITGFQIVGGTSQTYKNCYAANCTNGYVIGDLNNDNGLGVQVLTYSSFQNCGADNMTEYAYKCLGLSSVEFISPGAEEVHLGMFYFGTEKNNQGVLTKYNSATIRSPRALLNDGSFTTNCFIKNDGANTIDVYGLDSQTISGLYTKLIDSIGTNNELYVHLHNSSFSFSNQSINDAFTFVKNPQFGINGESFSSIPFQTPSNKNIKVSSEIKKLIAASTDFRVYLPTNGDVCFGKIDIQPIKWGAQVNPPSIGTIHFFGTNASGTIKASIQNNAKDVVVDTNYQSTVGGYVALRLGLTMTYGEAFLITVEVYTDQNGVTWERFAWI